MIQTSILLFCTSFIPDDFFFSLCCHPSFNPSALFSSPLFALNFIMGLYEWIEGFMWGCFCQGEKSERNEDDRLKKAASKMGQSVTRKFCKGLCVCVCEFKQNWKVRLRSGLVLWQGRLSGAGQVWDGETVNAENGLELMGHFCCSIGFGVTASCICAFRKILHTAIVLLLKLW